MKTEDKVAIWRRRIEVAAEVRDDEKNRVWDKNLMAFRGDLRPPKSVWSEEDPWISVELVHSSIRAAIPTLLYNNPKWSIEPKKPEFQMAPMQDPATGQEVQQMVDVSWEKARSKELWLEHVWKETEGNLQVRLAISAGFLALGAVRVGYAPDFADDELRGEIDYDDDGNPIIGRDGLPRLRKGEYLYDEKGEIVMDEDTGMPVPHPGKLQREKFFVEWVNWENLLFDPEGGNNFKNHRYVVEEWCRPLDHVKNDPRFPAHIRKKVKASPKERNETGALAATYDATRGDIEAVRYDEERVRGWDIYCFESNRYYVLCEEVEGAETNDVFLLDQKMPEGYEHGPFVFLKFNEDPGKWYPRTDAEAMAKIELEYNLTRSQMAMHRNQSRTRYFEVKGAGFDDDAGGEIEKAKFAHGPSGTLVKVRSADGVVPARKDAMDGSYFVTIPNIKEDFREVAGQPGENVGVADADTATQASLMAASADVRNSDRRDNLVQNFLRGIAAKLLQVAQANTTQVEWVKVRRQEGEPAPFDFVQINPEELDGEFEVNITVGSTQPKNTTNRIAMYERIVTMISQNPHIAASPELVKRLFEAIDLTDEKLIREVTMIGQTMLAAAGLPTSVAGGAQGPGLDGQGQPGLAAEGDVGQVIGEIANQFLQTGNAQQGVATGVRNR